MLVRNPSGTPELWEIGILELLQRYPCRYSEARWLDAALESWEADGEAMADDSDVIEAKAVVLVIPEQPGQPLRTELLAVELDQIREHNDSGRCGISIQADQPQKQVVLEKQGTVATTAEAAVE
mgnify:CR=1 FL=1